MNQKFVHEYRILFTVLVTILAIIFVMGFVRSREQRLPNRELIRYWIRWRAMRRGPNFTGPWYVDDKVAQRFALRDRIPREQQTAESECSIDPSRLGPIDNGMVSSSTL